MNKIVMCDTMIWYDLKAGVESFDKAKYKYYGSLSNMADFLASDKMNLGEEDKAKLKEAIMTMEKEADEIIMIDPTSVGASEWFNIPIRESEVKGIREVYAELLRYASGEDQTMDNPNIQGLIQTKEEFRIGSISTKKQLVDLFNSKPYTEEKQHEIIIGNILRWLLAEWNSMNDTSFSEDQVQNWESIEVFVKSYAEFLKTVKVDQPPNKNTMIDLLQLLYIRPAGSTLIWTKEKKLLAKIRSAFPESEWKNIIYQENIKLDS